ncbi:C1 family peptidase [Candidatus Gottesmanbacteria bacterium]|nr:C1 family peptidase [Candidatus Gottesmanbacteria bacterium]
MDEQSEQPRKISRRKFLRVAAGGIISPFQEPQVDPAVKEHVRKYLDGKDTGFRAASAAKLSPYLTRESLAGKLAIEVPQNFNFIPEIKNILMQYYDDCVPASIAHLSAWLFGNGSLIFSPRFLYWFRNRNNGATYPTIFDAWTGHGNATTEVVPYGPGLDIDTKPTNEQLAKAAAYKINQNDIISVHSGYQIFPNIDELAEIMYQNGPILAAVKAYSPEWDIWKEDKIIGKPGNEGNVFKHAVLLVGVNKDEGYINFANSWGENWGMGGFGKISIPDCYDGGTFTEMWAVDSQAIRSRLPPIQRRQFAPLITRG